MTNHETETHHLCQRGNTYYAHVDGEWFELSQPFLSNDGTPTFANIRPIKKPPRDITHCTKITTTRQKPT